MSKHVWHCSKQHVTAVLPSNLLQQENAATYQHTSEYANQIANQQDCFIDNTDNNFINNCTNNELNNFCEEETMTVTSSDNDNSSTNSMLKTTDHSQTGIVVDAASHLDHITASCLIEFLHCYETHYAKLTKLINEDIDCIELMALLVSCKASLALYGKITEWHHNCIASNASTKRLQARSTIIAQLAQRYMMHNLHPRLEKCILPSNGCTVMVPVQSFLSGVFSLLTSKDLMTTDNLIFMDSNDPSIVKPFEHYKYYADIDSGTAYHSYYQQHLSNKSNAVQIPIILFADGTVVDKSGRIQCEPFMFTLGIFKQHVRTRAHAWRNLGFIKSNTQYNQSKATIADTTSPIMKIKPALPEFVPDKHMDYHAQVRTILNDINTVQSINEGIRWNFTIDGVKNTKEYRLYFPILFIIGDTVEHNKLCSLRGGNKASRICCICDIPRDKLDTPCSAISSYEKNDLKKAGKRLPSHVHTLTDTRVLREKRFTNPQYVKDQGYYPCKQNILQELTFCDPLGLNVSVPPEVLHAILLCHGTRALNAFSRLTKQHASSMSVKVVINKASLQQQSSSDSSDESSQHSVKNYYVFVGKYKDEVEQELKVIGLALSRQSDPDKTRTHFPTGYLTAPNKKDDNTSGKKAAHELRGVLLTILGFLLLHNQQQALDKKLGLQITADYIHLFELTILLESWLTQEQYTEEELCLADKFLPLFTNTFVSTINRIEGHGMKLIKIHLLHHFVASIRLFGRTNNFHGGTGEAHLKPIKDHARRTKY